MILTNMNDLKEEMVLGKSIYLPNGDLLLAAGYRLKQMYLEKLQGRGYQYLYIQEPGTEQVIPEEIIDEQVKRNLEVSVATSFAGLESLALFKETSHRNLERELEKNKEGFRDLVINNAVKENLRSIIDQILENPNVVLNISALKNADNYFYTHAINVTIMSICIGKKFNFSREELESLAIGALCADVGLVAVPREIMENKGTLTEEEKNRLRDHTTYGHLILSQNPAIPPTATAVALQHHERQDGKGYPRGLTGDNAPPLKNLDAAHKIHRFAEIVSVADQYETLVSPPPYSPHPLTPLKAVEKLIRESAGHLNKPITEKFIGMIPLYPVGARFKILDCINPLLVGAHGVIAKQNSADLNRPQVLLLRTKKGQKIDPPRLVEMEKVPSMQIEILV
jgi:HD-GYP domain-containing protein (c-di-GMP phosphodiesterase class II)